MKELKKDELVERVKDLEFNLSGIRQTLESVPEDDGGKLPVGSSSDQPSDNEGATLYVTKKSGSAFTDQDLKALRKCAKLKGFTVRNVVADLAEKQS